MLRQANSAAGPPINGRCSEVERGRGGKGERYALVWVVQERLISGGTMAGQLWLLQQQLL